MRRTLVAAFFVAALASAASAADVGNGERQYVEFGCYACHGYNGTGETPLSSATSGVLSDEDVFLTYLRLRADQNPVNPKRSMPNYSLESLSDENARDIYAYLLTLEDTPPTVEEIPAFQVLLEDAKNRLSEEPENR